MSSSGEFVPGSFHRYSSVDFGARAPDLFARKQRVSLDTAIYLEGYEGPFGPFRSTRSGTIETEILLQEPLSEGILILPDPKWDNTSYHLFLGAISLAIDAGNIAREAGLLIPNVHQIVKLNYTDGESQRTVLGLLRSNTEATDAFWLNTFNGHEDKLLSILHTFDIPSITPETIPILLQDIPIDIFRIISSGIRLPPQESVFNLVNHNGHLRIYLENLMDAEIKPYSAEEAVATIDTLLNSVIYIIQSNLHNTEKMENDRAIQELFHFKSIHSPITNSLRNLINPYIMALEIRMNLVGASGESLMDLFWYPYSPF